jgi:hypothetical protein
MSKFLFRVVLAIIAGLSLFSGYLGYRYGAVNYYYGLPDHPEFTSGLLMLDSNFRFYNGLWTGIGLILIWMIPNAARKTDILFVLSALFVCGGIGRVFSIFTCGTPPLMYVLFLPLEFGFPLLALWQRQLSSRA